MCWHRASRKPLSRSQEQFLAPRNLTQQHNTPGTVTILQGNYVSYVTPEHIYIYMEVGHVSGRETFCRRPLHVVMNNRVPEVCI